MLKIKNRRNMKRLALFALVMVAAFGCSAPVSVNDAFLQDWTFWSDRNPEKLTVNLPHDAMQLEVRSADADAGNANAYYPGGKYYYEKTFVAQKSILDSHVTLDFEGVYQHAKVYVNDVLAGANEFGYGEFIVCLDGLLKEGENVIRVEADNSQAPNSRWYSGGGIYRPVTIKVQQKDNHINSVKVLTKSIAPATVSVSTDYVGDATVKTTILYAGNKVAQAEGANVDIQIADAKLWSAADPNLYKVQVELVKDNNVVDTYNDEFGIRTIEWSNKGFIVNGQKVLLAGGCIHHDNGILGSAEYDETAIRKIEILKDYGFNAVRSAHNPTSKAILKACDRLGMYVMDELADTWYKTKTEFDYGNYFMDNYKGDIASMVNKDYNHPSVVMYSIGNEITEPAKPEGREVEKDLVASFHELDPSRPVTAGLNLMLIMMGDLDVALISQQLGAGNSQQNQQKQEASSEDYNAMVASQGNSMMNAVLMPIVDPLCSPACDLLDISGYNYGSARYTIDAQIHPDRILVGSETMPYSISENWKMVKEMDNLVGDFMWTAWDYIGEVGIGAWFYGEGEGSFTKPFPWKLADTGALDILGNPNGEAYLAKAVFLENDEPYICVSPISDKPLIKAMWRGYNSIPSWSWEGCEGKQTTVEVFTSAPKVALYLNEEKIDEVETDNHVATFPVTYAEGTLKAVATGTDGKEHVATLSSATGSKKITISQEKPAKAGELVYLDINITGQNGEVIANADHTLSVKVEGADLIAYGSAQPRTEESFLSGTYTTYQGRSLAAIMPNKKGKITVTVTGGNMSASYSFKAN